MKTSSRALPFLASLGVALLLAVVFFTATSQGQALAQQFLSLFFNTAPDQRPMPTETTPVAVTPAASLAQGEDLTGWKIGQPAWLPEGFSFNRIENRPEAGNVIQVYTFTPATHKVGMEMTAGYFYLTQSKAPLKDKWPVGESAKIETVQIGDISGEYVIGVWGGEVDHLVWQNLLNFQHLRWKAGGFYYEIEAVVFGMDEADLPESPFFVPKESLLAIAKSMQ